MAQRSTKKRADDAANQEQALARKSQRTHTHSLQHDLTQTVMLLPLPMELRLLIWEQLFDDEPVNLLTDIYRSSLDKLKEPAITWTNHVLRAETLPLYYRRTSFEFNISRYGIYEKLRAGTLGSKSHFLRKVTFYGRSLQGQLNITIDFGSISVLDARWRQYQNSQSRQASITHWHIQRDLEPLMMTLQQAQHSQEAFAAMLEAITSLFQVPNSKRAFNPARKSGTFALDASGPCTCMRFVAPSVGGVAEVPRQILGL